jgi:ATP-dependent DNA helicase RecG
LQQGRASATWYRPTEKLIGNRERQSEYAEILSGKSEALPSKRIEQRDSLLNELPGQMATRVGAIGQRHPPEQVRALVVELCRLRPWRTEELTLLLNRRPETIRHGYLNPLLAEKRIEMTLPDTPNSPQQAYRSVEKDTLDKRLRL